jgi:hypothetical protein
MNPPQFKASKQFLRDLKLPCLAVTLKNSSLPGLASQHIAEFQQDPTFTIYLRSKNPGETSPWQRERLRELFEQERLPAIVAEGLQVVVDDLKQYDYADLLDDEREFARAHGYAPFAYVELVVIDDVEQKVVIDLNDGVDVIHEQGWTIYWEKGRWQHGDGEYVIKYAEAIEQGLESKP